MGNTKGVFLKVRNPIDEPDFSDRALPSETFLPYLYDEFFLPKMEALKTIKKVKLRHSALNQRYRKSDWQRFHENERHFRWKTYKELEDAASQVPGLP